MRLDELIKNIQDTSLKHVLVNEFGEGDIYEYLNTGEHKYPCVFLTVTGLSDVDYTREVNITLFYVDRLTSDQSNRKSIQSTATDVLGDIIHSLESNSVTYTLFTEKFSDLCAGAYAEFTVTVEYTAGCEQNFIVRTKKIENNGVYNVEDFDEVEVDVKGCSEEIVVYYENQINHLTEENENKQAYIDTVTGKTITENGTYTPEEGILGWNNINVNVTSASEVWKVPNGTRFYNCFWSSFPALDFSNVTDFVCMFYNCTTLTTIPLIDTSKGTKFGSMFTNCSKLTTIPQLDTSKGTDFDSMFYKCSSLTTIPQLDTSKGKMFSDMFYNCSNLTTVTQLDISGGTTWDSLNYVFSGCEKLENVTFVGSINYSFECHSPVLTYDSVKSILTACSNTTNTNSKTLKFTRTITDQNGELAALIADCNSKKWTISGLTLQ